MSPRVFKYTFEIVGEQTIEMHAPCNPGSQYPDVLHVGVDPMGNPCLWAEVDGDSFSTSKAVTLTIVGTGHPLSEHRGNFLGTFIHRAYVWHVYSRQLSRRSA